MTNQNIKLLCQYNPNNDQLEIIKSQNFDSLNLDSKYTIEDAVGHIIGATNTTIKELIKEAGGSKLFAEGRSFVLEFGYNYAINLQQAREKYGEEGYRDELTAIGKSTASFIVGASGSNAGKLASSILFSSLPAKIGSAIVGGIISSELYEKYAQESMENFFNNLIDNNLSTTPNSTSIGYQQQDASGNIQLQKDFYHVKSGDTLSAIAQSFGTTTDKLINANPFLTSENRISLDGKYILIKEGEKLSLATSEIKNSVKLEDVTLKSANGIDVGNFSNFFLDQANKTLLTNTDLDSKWKIDNGFDSLVNTKIEFDFNSLAQKILGTSSKNWDGVSAINNSLLNLEVNTNLTSDFAGSNDLNQAGNVIGDSDWRAIMPINVINGDGYKNVASSGIVSDGFRPGNSELSSYSNFNTQLNVDFSRLDNLTNQLNRANQNQSIPDISKLNLQLQNPLAQITNNAINARTFLNIDPVVLDLNDDGVKLTSYNNSEVTFDVDNDGKQERTGWVSNQDGILVEDQNNNGKIDNITETISEYYKLQGSNWIKDIEGKYSSDGLATLKKLDSNNDGKFNNQDAKWNDLKIWQDANGDAVTDIGELKNLNEAGIKEFNLSNIEKATKERNEGNIILTKSTYTTVDNKIKQVAAVDFTTNPIGYEFNDVNLGKLATAEDGTKSLIIKNENGEIIISGIDNAQNIFGNIGDDSITGDDRDNWLSGGGGSDTLKGEKGDDILIIDSADSQENIDGGEGRDIAIINSDNGVSFNLTQSNIETVVGGNGNDVLIGGGTSNVFIDGGSGDDIIIGGSADDALAGSDGNDYVDGGYGDDLIRGHRGNDVLTGGVGNDYLEGGLGDDKIFGGLGNEVIMEGGGNDEIDGGSRRGGGERIEEEIRGDGGERRIIEKLQQFYEQKRTRSLTSSLNKRNLIISDLRFKMNLFERNPVPIILQRLKGNLQKLEGDKEEIEKKKLVFDHKMREKKDFASDNWGKYEENIEKIRSKRMKSLRENAQRTIQECDEKLSRIDELVEPIKQEEAQKLEKLKREEAQKLEKLKREEAKELEKENAVEISRIYDEKIKKIDSGFNLKKEEILTRYQASSRREVTNSSKKPNATPQLSSSGRVITISRMEPLEIEVTTSGPRKRKMNPVVQEAIAELAASSRIRR